MAAAVEVKSIKPQRFKDAAFTAAIVAAAREVADAMQRDFEKTVETWDKKPKFEKLVSVDPNVEVLVGTDNEIYDYLNNGTGLWGPKKKKYPIFAGIYTGRSAKKALRFQWGGKGSYRAKTKPRTIGSRPGGPSGPIVVRPYVQHPGIQPRKFDETIEKKWRSPFKRRMERAMADAGKASGHG